MFSARLKCVQKLARSFRPQLRAPIISNTPKIPSTRLASTLVAYPDPKYIQAEKDDGLDVEVLPVDHMKLTITDSASDQLKRISDKEGNKTLALRVAIESGGCHGYQYKLDLVDSHVESAEKDDYRFSVTDDPDGPGVLVDAVSFQLLRGSTLDFSTELIGSSFKVLDNPQAQGSGCGCGVSVSL
ncbi:hypothetical protein J056_000245 [Wallemia ichthyophaga EXF-994]|uniref:Core domain-containing protein n=1 Tax=Wallemia ichthyophaga (strain EXF-994 / CBS 113033) TaxID=1299270 RepID=R9AXR3_WALI9|nr:uncharacterized protein J056_000245 [Wallemia ichthyophaga EXF-994]EOR04891.1 hypothetical protein J056_000245 [Wallemia ichthyophaga EXF-994]TIB37285.1 hypothetical protein E3P84_00363 [Wallemia ichthyophaga]TIB43795.1 hypothetical protein E3P83_00506 [Wallemia ichthyophaga]